MTFSLRLTPVTRYFNKSISVSHDTKNWMTLNTARAEGSFFFFFIRLDLKRFSRAQVTAGEQ